MSDELTDAEQAELEIDCIEEIVTRLDGFPYRAAMEILLAASRVIEEERMGNTKGFDAALGEVVEMARWRERRGH